MRREAGRPLPVTVRAATGPAGAGCDQAERAAPEPACELRPGRAVDTRRAGIPPKPPANVHHDQVRPDMSTPRDHPLSHPRSVATARPERADFRPRLGRCPSRAAKCGQRAPLREVGHTLTTRPVKAAGATSALATKRAGCLCRVDCYAGLAVRDCHRPSSAGVRLEAGPAQLPLAVGCCGWPPGCAHSRPATTSHRPTIRHFEWPSSGGQLQPDSAPSRRDRSGFALLDSKRLSATDETIWL